MHSGKGKRAASERVHLFFLPKSVIGINRVELCQVGFARSRRQTKPRKALLINNGIYRIEVFAVAFRSAQSSSHAVAQFASPLSHRQPVSFPEWNEGEGRRAEPSRPTRTVGCDRPRINWSGDAPVAGRPEQRDPPSPYGLRRGRAFWTGRAEALRSRSEPQAGGKALAKAGEGVASPIKYLGRWRLRPASLPAPRPRPTAPAPGRSASAAPVRPPRAGRHKPARRRRSRRRDRGR